MATGSSPALVRSAAALGPVKKPERLLAEASTTTKVYPVAEDGRPPGFEVRVVSLYRYPACGNNNGGSGGAIACQALSSTGSGAEVTIFSVVRPKPRRFPIELP
jgi:hypothetical protein